MVAYCIFKTERNFYASSHVSRTITIKAFHHVKTYFYEIRSALYTSAMLKNQLKWDFKFQQLHSSQKER
ncbi:hypothetical protein SLEP1_g12310 [Rubroshorea leprosula]|uniref:Uncharacterized protein n=1 Tax=Rubroshorea leprosula TaxID=152421 RepID=A0AAV5ILJ3_9ROSI|nr:hypothetical protein SLEP1_g12310 [Rubroshorea leprosula]